MTGESIRFFKFSMMSVIGLLGISLANFNLGDWDLGKPCTLVRLGEHVFHVFFSGDKGLKKLSEKLFFHPKSPMMLSFGLWVSHWNYFDKSCKRIESTKIWNSSNEPSMNQINEDARRLEISSSLTKILAHRLPRRRTHRKRNIMYQSSCIVALQIHY